MWLSRGAKTRLFLLCSLLWSFVLIVSISCELKKSDNTVEGHYFTTKGPSVHVDYLKNGKSDNQ
jgi:hypothetical protein